MQIASSSMISHRHVCQGLPALRPARGGLSALAGVPARGAALRRGATSPLCGRATPERAAKQTSEQAATTPVATSTAYLALLGLLTPFLADSDALAAGNPLLTGKTVSLLHPAIMLFLFGASLYTGWLGLQWREARTIPALVKDLKAQLPKADAEGKRAPSSLDGEIAELEQKRKELIKSNPRDKHNNWGSLLLGLGVAISIEGPVNTYLRAGKLFPGPHLYAGAAIVVLWALAAALTPAMQKGNDVARTLHITLNSINVLLFAWQIPTGFDIVQKVWANVAWP